MGWWTKIPHLKLSLNNNITEWIAWRVYQQLVEREVVVVLVVVIWHHHNMGVALMETELQLVACIKLLRVIVNMQPPLINNRYRILLLQSEMIKFLWNLDCLKSKNLRMFISMIIYNVPPGSKILFINQFYRWSVIIKQVQLITSLRVNE